MVSSSDKVAIEYLRRRIPGLPDDFGSDRDSSLFGSLKHGEATAAVMAAMNLVPGLDRDAFRDDTPVGALLDWIGGALDESGSGSNGGVVVRPRGSYATASVTLRPINELDVARGYEASLSPVMAHRWRYRGRTPAPEAFRQALFGEPSLAQFAVVRVGDLTATGLGIVAAYQAEMSDGVCTIAFQRFIDDEPSDAADGERARGLMVEGLLVFIQFLFDHFRLRKIYAEVAGFNRDLFDHGIDHLFVEEGLLRRHYYYGDRFWDHKIYALYRERWDEVAAPYRGKWPDGLD